MAGRTPVSGQHPSNCEKRTYTITHTMEMGMHINMTKNHTMLTQTFMMGGVVCGLPLFVVFF